MLALVLALIAVGAGLFLVFYERHERTGAAGETASSPATGNVSLPVIVVGADCATLGAAGVTEAGDPAYCARLASSGAPIWSLYPGEVAHPAGAEAVPAGEAPVLVCMEQTGKTRLDCHDDILQENTDPGANDKAS